MHNKNDNKNKMFQSIISTERRRSELTSSNSWLLQKKKTGNFYFRCLFLAILFLARCNVFVSGARNIKSRQRSKQTKRNRSEKESNLRTKRKNINRITEIQSISTQQSQQSEKFFGSPATQGNRRSIPQSDRSIDSS